MFQVFFRVSCLTLLLALTLSQTANASVSVVGTVDDFIKNGYRITLLDDEPAMYHKTDGDQLYYYHSERIGNGDVYDSWKTYLANYSSVTQEDLPPTVARGTPLSWEHPNFGVLYGSLLATFSSYNPEKLPTPPGYFYIKVKCTHERCKYPWLYKVVNGSEVKLSPSIFSRICGLFD